MEISPQPELLAATKSAQITGYVLTDLVTYCSVTYVTPPFFKKLSPSASSILVGCDRSKDLYEASPIVVQGSLPSWFLHFDHHFTCNKTFKSMLTFPGSIGSPLFLLCLFHIEQNIFVDVRYELHFLQKLRCSHFNINIIISRSS